MADVALAVGGNTDRCRLCGDPVEGIDAAVGLELSNGRVIYPAADGEGNGGGALFGYTERDGEVVPFTVVPRRERGV